MDRTENAALPSDDANSGRSVSDHRPVFSESDCEIIEQFENAFQSALLHRTHLSELTPEELIAEFRRTFCQAEHVRSELAKLFEQLSLDQTPNRQRPNKPR